MKVINQSRQKQQVCFVDGSAITVYPGKSANVSIKKIYPDELERIKKKFKVEEPKKQSPKEKPVSKKETDEKPLEDKSPKEKKPLENNGGNK